ncbi:MAG: DUF5703 domain-containing protein [Kiritimatiellae bacterium]|nr:DUF5703 domain-containing protein [Kiritimatiellia bacterium]MDD5522967.1 DUF5703 domain-containing protein [Kiritimatiellia bacterium]
MFNLQINRVMFFYFVLTSSAVAVIAGENSPPLELDKYDVVWNTPGTNASSSMPIGNGEIGLNVWVEENGDLRFYIGRTDSWSETCRLLKVGAMRLSLSPNPFAKGLPFRQQLILRDGRIEITGGAADAAVKLRLFVDVNAPVIHIIGESAKPISVRTSTDIWRTEEKTLAGSDMETCWTMGGAPFPIKESADVVVDGKKDTVVWYHRNSTSIVPFTLKHQGLENFALLVRDPILNRTFGGCIAAPGFVKDGNIALKSKEPVKSFSVSIAVHSAVTKTAAKWEKEIEKISRKSADPEKVEKTTAQWWADFWNRSWIFVQGDISTVNSIPTNNYPLSIGADSRGGSVFRGMISRATVYKRALKDEEVSLLASGSPGNESVVKNGQLVALRFDKQPSDVKFAGKISVTQENGIGVAKFDGGHVEITNPEELKNSLTLEAWIRPVKDAGSARIFDKITAGGSDGFLFDTHPGKALRFIMGSSAIATSNNILRTEEWNHVVAVYDGATGAKRLYLNGKLVGGVSSIYEDQPTPSRVTRAYVLQRWISACSARGNFPIKFNGNLFTVEPSCTDPGKQGNPDYRRWGDCYWYQNTRFPYLPMPVSGDYDMMRTMFRFFAEGIPLCNARAKLYFESDGVYFPETMTCFYTYANRDYGWKREGLKPHEKLSPWWWSAWQQGLELTDLMLDYYDHTADDKFLAKELIPMAREVLKYYDTRFKRDNNGRLIISPAQAVETYWIGVTNDAPSVAGLNAVTARLMDIPEKKVPKADRALWAKMKASAPAVPMMTKEGIKCLAPAEYFDPKRNNCENPCLYAVWPFRLYGIGRSDLATAIETWKRREAKIMTGWCYDGQAAAILGMTEEAKEQILTKVRNSHPRHRFPAMWGPNFDWLPDQDHGNNILLTLQNMVMRNDGMKIYLLQAWPMDWNLDFKLHAAQQTVVEGKVRGGKLVEYSTTPKSRMKDVIVVNDSMRGLK